MRIVVIIAGLLFLAPMALAMDEATMDPTKRGPAVGAMIPSDLTSTDQDGKARSFDNLKGEKGLVLVFYRSAKWCPYCKRQLVDISKNMSEITSRGYGLAALSYDSTDILKRFSDDRNLGYTLLSDPKSEIIDTFGIRNEGYKNMAFAYGVPHPMIFVIGPDMVIQAKLAEDGYKKRPPVHAVAEAIDALAATKG
ncbi:MAG: alkyl hydroperoxide reductase [Robiginitomaculum sp.]|nr:MAG: alkyl hydroperoxide reductase [Robiginitomaculum sp.]